LKLSIPGVLIGIVMVLAIIAGTSFGFFQLGKTMGLQIGEKEGLAKGIVIGEKNGYQRGYDAGKTDGQKSGYDNGYQSVQKLIDLLSQQIGDGTGLYEGEQVGYNDGYTSAYTTVYPVSWQTGWLAGYQYYYVNASADVDVNVTGQQPAKPGKSNLPAPGSIQAPNAPSLPAFQIPDHQSRFTHSGAAGRPGFSGLRR